MAKLPVLITRIDIDAGAERKNYLVQAKQGDKATRFVSVLIVEDGKEYACLLYTSPSPRDRG